jgi:hypothetical protein
MHTPVAHTHTHSHSRARAHTHTHTDAAHTVPTMHDLGLSDITTKTPFRGGETAALERMERHLKDKVRLGANSPIRSCRYTVTM